MTTGWMRRSFSVRPPFGWHVDVERIALPKHLIRPSGVCENTAVKQGEDTVFAGGLSHRAVIGTACCICIWVTCTARTSQHTLHQA